MPLFPYDPYNHYWKLTTDATFPGTTHVYSSFRQGFFVLADATYVAWLAVGHLGATVADRTELATELARFGLAISADNAGVIPATSQVSNNNLITNGGMDFFQRQAPGTATARSDDTYGPDRFYVLTQTAAVNCERSTGDSGRYACKLTQNQASSQRLGLAQIVQHTDSRPMRGREVRAQLRFKMSSGAGIRIALLEWTGTADVVTSDVVNDWTSGTFTAGNFFLASSLTVVSVVSVAAVGGAGVWASASATGIISSSANNLIVMVWTSGAASTNATLEVSEVGLYDANLARPWLPRQLDQEKLLCMARYSKSYEVDTAPGTASKGEAFPIENGTVGNGVIYANKPFPVPMAGIPAVACYSYVGTLSRFGNGSGTDFAANSGLAANITPISFTPYNGSGGTLTMAGGAVIGNFVAECEL